MTRAEAREIRRNQTLESLVYGIFYEYPIISGFVADSDDLTKRWIVELFVDGWPIDMARADRFDFRMPDVGSGSSDFGFVFDVGRLKLDISAVIEIRLANTDDTLARLLEHETSSNIEPAVPGEVTWLGGLRFTGWVARETDARHQVRALIDDDVVAECETQGLTLIEDGAASRARPAFDLYLPRQYADGRARVLDVVDEDGRSLSGCPLSFIAYDHDVASAVAERARIPAGPMRSALLDRLVAKSVPFADVEAWSTEFFPSPKQAVTSQIGLVLIGDDDVEITLEGLAQVDGDWILAALSSEKRDGRFYTADLVEFLEQDAAKCNYLAFALSGTRFGAGALQRFVAALDASPLSDFVYCDTFVETENGATIPIAFPAFDYERLLEQGYPAWCFACRTEKARELAADGADSLIDLFLRGLDDSLNPELAPRHIPGFLATRPPIDVEAASVALTDALTSHLRLRHQRAKIERKEGGTFPAVLLKRAVSADSVGVVIPVHNDSERVRSCLDHLSSLPERHRLDIVVVDMASNEPELFRYVDRVDKARVRRIRVNGPLNVARALNSGARLVQNKHLLFLNPVVELGHDVIDDLMSRCAEPDVAGAGSPLMSSEGLILTAGFILEHARGAVSACFGCGTVDFGYGDLLTVAHERSALSAACLLVKREDHIAIRGFDEISFAREFFSVDYCLRLRARGRRLVMSPHHRCFVRPGARAEFRITEPTDRHAARRREVDLLRLRWGHVLDEDPFYSPLLCLDGAPFSALAFPPRTCAFQSSRLSVIKDVAESKRQKTSEAISEVMKSGEAYADASE